MTTVQVRVAVEIVSLALSAALTTLTDVRRFVKQLSPGITDEELNAIIHGVRADAMHRKHLAEADLAALDAEFPGVS